MAHQYGFLDLETSVSDYLREILNIKNVCIIFDAARLYQLEFLTKVNRYSFFSSNNYDYADIDIVFYLQVCHEYMDKHALEVIQHESFLQLSPSALNELIARNSFYAPEIDVFLAVQAWVKANPEVEAKDVVGKSI